MQKETVEPHSLPKSFEAFLPSQRVCLSFLPKDFCFLWVLPLLFFEWGLNCLFIVCFCFYFCFSSFSDAEDLFFKGPECKAQDCSL